MSLECLASAITECVGNLAIEHASPYVGYFFHFGKNVKQFKDQREALELKKDRVESDVAEAKRQTEVIEKDVEEWLNKAEKELGEAQSLEQEIERNKCFNWCSSWGWRYCLSIKVAKKTPCISKLIDTGNFQRVGRRPALQGTEFLLPKDFMASESSNSAFNGIMKALNSDGVNMIGLYGMPGVGKTTLAEVVGKQANEQKLFDKVVSVTVSQTPNFDEIRKRIAELLGFKFEAETEKGKAEELCRRLQGEKKILIILDDIWQKHDLQTIKIPFGGEHEGCKILLTTRLQQVCTQMDCHEEFELNVLSEDEAWALFKDKAGLKDDSPTVNVAKEVARECGCLPLAIVTVAQALKCESLDEWIAANKRLKSSRHLDNEHVCGEIYKCLKFSYDYLRQDNIRQCFLLCSLFPEDYEISIELLTLCGIGQGLFDGNFFMEDLRREIHLALSKLQKSGLLLEAKDKEHIKMHDVVRDFAHWITSSGENMFMVKNELMEWLESKNFGCYTAISLWNIKIDNFPDRLEFAKLKILILTGKNRLRVPSTFFEGMKTLQVLYLDHVEFSMEALQFLTNLQTLYIAWCYLGNISSLKNLKKLELLYLVMTNIDELPEEVVELHRLKSLYFSYSEYGDSSVSGDEGSSVSGDEGSSVPPNLISRLTSLQELHLIGKTIANLSELNSLSRLSALTLTVSTDQCFQENFVFPKLHSYNIAVNTYVEFSVKPDSRILRISDFSSSLNAFKELFRNVQKLALFQVKENKNIVANVDQWGLNELTSLKLDSCDNLECLIDTTQEQSPTTGLSNLAVSRSNLRSLKLNSLPTLESIWKEPTHHVSLQSLKKVIILGCHELKSIFSPCLAQSLLHLEKLKISECKNLEQVFAFDKEMAELQARPLSNLRSLNLYLLPTLKSIWEEPTHHVSLQSLKEVRIHFCDELKSIFSACLIESLLHLEELIIYKCKNLEQVFAFDKEMAEQEDVRLYGVDHAIALPSLQILRLANLINLSSENFPISSPFLEKLTLLYCPKLTNVTIQKEVNGQIQLKELVLSKLGNSFQLFISANRNENGEEYIEVRSHEEEFQVHGRIKELRLRDLSEVQIIWKDVAEVVTLENLTILKVSNCKRLRYIFSPTTARSLSQLKSLDIVDCDELDQSLLRIKFAHHQIVIPNLQAFLI